ncbi:MAG: hypothetical protein HYY24_02755 [Verrucomicrobia bacterium]|nr:hypothetical protein [Verrucomicrobiota bacterium]
MANDNYILEEWKMRYASYQHYGGQYLTVLSVTATAWLVAFGFSMSANTIRAGRLAILAFMLLAAVTVFIAHCIARRSVRQLGERIAALERELELKEFATTEPLERALKVTQVGSAFAVLITLTLFLCI